MSQEKVKICIEVLFYILSRGPKFGINKT